MSVQRRLAIALLAAGSLTAAEIPVRQVTLYKHGVGFFDRQGKLAAGESARLDFKASEMDDVLKSLTVTEKGGGKISGLRYDSSLPLEQRLDEFPFKLGPGNSLVDVLDQLKGSLVEFRIGNDRSSGTIVAARRVPGTERAAEAETVSVMTAAGELQTLALAGITSMRFLDPKLQVQFRDYLGVLSSSRSKERRSVYIDSSDTRERDIAASYLIPAPVWKSSYRLFLADGQPTLEGWAIVDNTTGDDWINVRLALVSGKPISFISPLYEPKYVARQEADVIEQTAQAAVVHESAMDAAPQMAKGLGAGRGGGVIGGVPGGIASGFRGGVAQSDAMASGGGGNRIMALSNAAPMIQSEAIPPPPPARRFERSSLGTMADGRELGELFEYTIDKAVTVKRGESSMIPFLQQKLGARKLLIYSDEQGSSPLNSFELTNSTGKTLDGGPITVFEGGAYGGEALMETLKAGEKRLISYAVDLGTRVSTVFDSSSSVVREIHVKRGVLTSRTAQVETKTYTVSNVDAKAKTLVIEHPARPGYQVVSPKPSETTTKAFRFEVALDSKANRKFPVTEERIYEQSAGVTSLTPDVLAAYAQNKVLSADARRQIEQISALKQRIAAADRDARRLEGEINNIFRDQERIRQNLVSLNQVSGQQEQVQNYSRQLATQEKQLAAARDRKAEAEKQKAALESELNAMIEKLEF